jgi:hypothetical protein
VYDYRGSDEAVLAKGCVIRLHYDYRNSLNFLVPK